MKRAISKKGSEKCRKRGKESFARLQEEGSIEDCIQLPISISSNHEVVV